MAILNSKTINIYQMPESGDQVIMPDGSSWTLKQREAHKWGLYDKDNNRHEVGLFESMNALCGELNQIEG